MNLETTTDCGSYYGELGRLNMVELEYVASYKFCHKAKWYSQLNAFIDTLTSNETMVKDKMSIFEKLKLKIYLKHIKYV